MYYVYIHNDYCCAPLHKNASCSSNLPLGTESHLDAWIQLSILMNVIVPKLEYAGEVWEGESKSIKQPETVQMDSSYISARMQIRRTIQYYEQNWESTHLKQEETLEGWNANIK